MLPLAGGQPPTSVPELTTALRLGLAAHGVKAEVMAEGGTWPQVSTLRIALSRISQPRPPATTPSAEGVEFGRVEIRGEPVLIEALPASVRAELSEVRAGFGQAPDGSWQLVMASAQAGTVFLEASVADVQAAVHLAIDTLASKQGATLKETKVVITSPNARTVRFEVTCTAKVFIATATLTVVGEVVLNDQLEANVRELAVIGEGMIANMARGFLAPHLNAWNGRVIPLGNYIAAGLKVKDIRITAGDRVRIEAEFDSAK